MKREGRRTRREREESQTGKRKINKAEEKIFK